MSEYKFDEIIENPLTLDVMDLRGKFKTVYGKVNKDIDPSAIKQLELSGRKPLDYVSGGYAITMMNNIFGLGWNSSIAAGYPRVEDLGEAGGKHAVTCSCVVDIEIPALGVVRSGSGVGVATARKRGDALDTAFKASETDAFKRAVRTIGRVLGLQLYQRDVGEILGKSAPAGKPKAASRVDYSDLQSELDACVDLNFPESSLQLMGDLWSSPDFQEKMGGMDRSFRKTLEDRKDDYKEQLGYVLNG